MHSILFREVQTLGNSRLKSAIILIAGIAIGVLSMWGYGAVQGVKPHVVEGYSSGTNYEGTAMGVSQGVGGMGESDGYVIAGARWREFGGSWHDSGTPHSLEWLSYSQKVRLGVIDYKPTKSAPGSSAVVWLEVLDTEHMVKE
jgi:hypothetical protein